MSPTPAELGARITAKLSGLDQTLGLVVTYATGEVVEARLVIDDRHRQIHGIVHGGVYASIVETVGSVGAWLATGDDNRAVVGLDNHTSFLRAVREGTLHARAEAIHRGRSTQLWEVRICDDEGRLAATGRLRSMILDAKPMSGSIAPSLASPHHAEDAVPQTLSSHGVKENVG